MRIAFNSKKLRQICEQEETAVTALGADVAKKLAARLADLSAAYTVFELVAGDPRSINGTDEYAISLGGTCRLVFVGNHVRNPALESGSTDWSRVRNIKIIRIDGCHD